MPVSGPLHMLLHATRRRARGAMRSSASCAGSPRRSHARSCTGHSQSADAALEAATRVCVCSIIRLRVPREHAFRWRTLLFTDAVEASAPTAKLRHQTAASPDRCVTRPNRSNCSNVSFDAHAYIHVPQTIMMLDVELWKHMLNFLDNFSLLNVNMVCRLVKHIIMDETFCEGIMRKRFRRRCACRTSCDPMMWTQFFLQTAKDELDIKLNLTTGPCGAF